MKRALDLWFTPALALGVLGFVGLTTMAAVRRFDIWRGRAHDVALQLQADPYAEFERSLVDSQQPDLSSLRNPFALASATPPGGERPRPRIRPPAPVEPEPPRLTAIVWSPDDPRAVIQWNGHSYSVRTGQGFESFRVVRIARDRVILDQAGQTLALELRKKGE